MDTSAVLGTTGWHVHRLISTLSFADVEAWLVERWSIVAEATLDELLVEVALDGLRPWPADGFAGRASDPMIEFDVHGAEVTATKRISAGRFEIDLRLPSPLIPGEHHDFELTVSEPRFERIRHHVHRPTVTCRRLDLRVHFPLSTAPRVVTPFVGDPSIPNTSDAEVPAVLAVDRCGEANTTFRNVQPGRLHGFTWAALSV